MYLVRNEKLTLPLGSTVVAQSLSHVRLFETPWTAAPQAPLFFTTPGICSNSCALVSDTIQPSHPLLPSSPLALSLSQHQGLYQ